MTKQTTLTGIELPVPGRVSVKIEIDTEINISAYVARQKANRFLILQAGDQLGAAAVQHRQLTVMSGRTHLGRNCRRWR